MNLSRLEVVIVVAAVIVLCIGFYVYGDSRHDELNSCNCTVSYGGHNMSVEDAFERAGEGLTADQADEVQILIEEYCND